VRTAWLYAIDVRVLLAFLVELPELEDVVGAKLIAMLVNHLYAPLAACAGDEQLVLPEHITTMSAERMRRSVLVARIERAGGVDSLCALYAGASSAHSLENLFAVLYDVAVARVIDSGGAVVETSGSAVSGRRRAGTAPIVSLTTDEAALAEPGGDPDNELRVAILLQVLRTMNAPLSLHRCFAARRQSLSSTLCATFSPRSRRRAAGRPCRRSRAIRTRRCATAAALVHREHRRRNGPDGAPEPGAGARVCRATRRHDQWRGDADAVDHHHRSSSQQQRRCQLRPSRRLRCRAPATICWRPTAPPCRAACGSRGRRFAANSCRRVSKRTMWAARRTTTRRRRRPTICQTRTTIVRDVVRRVRKASLRWRRRHVLECDDADEHCCCRSCRCLSCCLCCYRNRGID
jgi:hypothetical protein